MENEDESRNASEGSKNKEAKPRNPNSIGKLLSLSKDIPTSPDKVYRSVKDKAAIDDLIKSGVVRNKQSAGLVTTNRWGDTVFWSKGEKDKYHIVSQNGYVIEAPLSVATERTVKREDITAIYTKNEAGEVSDILQQERDQKTVELAEQKTHLDSMVEIDKKDTGENLANVRKIINDI